MGFPQLANIDKTIVTAIKAKTKSNVTTSKVMPWIRVVSCLGDFLVLESSREAVSFTQQYGNTGKSGRIGTDKNGKSIYAEDDRGFRPSPTIDSINISQGNEGLSKKTSFTIICYSLGQAELVMEYFMEPGNHVLVEWGENTNASINQKCDPLDACTIIQYNNLSYTQTKRKDSGAHYDAVLGTITNGGLSYGDNETFNIDVELTSIGELPAYLQHHKGIETGKKSADSGETFSPNEVGKVATNVHKRKDVGYSLYMQMFNKLPSHKRSNALKDLPLTQKWLLNSANYVNIDESIRKDLVDSTKDVKLVSENDKELKIPTDIPLFSDKSFIRVAVAFTILDFQNRVELTPRKIDGCNNELATTTNGIINWRSTICRAHRNMFSANSNFLYIPNRQHPSFDLAGALSTDGEWKKPLGDLNIVKGNFLTDTVDTHPFAYHDKAQASYFPKDYDLEYSDQAKYDSSYLSYEADSGEWGYLRDLYINFEFFCKTLEASLYNTKDIYYELLNGMSSAVNMYWDFQIIPRGAVLPPPCTDDGYAEYVRTHYQTADGQEELHIVDATFTGKVKDRGLGKAAFQSRGLKTPFLSAELKFDIPSAMKGQIIGRKLSKLTKNPNKEQPEVDMDGLFTTRIDDVSQKLNIFNVEGAKLAKDKEKASETPDERRAREDAEVKQSKEDKEQQAKANYELFIGNGCVVPRVQDRGENIDVAKESYDWWSANETTIEKLAVICGYNDPNLLKKVQLLNEGRLKGNIKTQFTTGKNPPLLPIKFNFTIHGVSGLRVGDTFAISDLPLKYKNKIFQITQISHEVSTNIWQTTVEGSLRNLDRTIDG